MICKLSTKLSILYHLFEFKKLIRAIKNINLNKKNKYQIFKFGKKYSLMHKFIFSKEMPKKEQPKSMI